VLQWRPPQPLAIAQKIPLVLSLYALAPLLLWGFATVEGRSFTVYGLSWDANVLVSLGAGLSLGIVGVGILFGLERWLGWIDWQTRPAQLGSVLLPTFILGVLISLIEELVFRGFLLNHLQQDYSVWLAAAGSSLIFALLHLVWEGTTIAPQLPGLWLMGIVLVVARWADGGSIGLAWGLHAGWIWGMASLDAAQAIQYREANPEWMTGLKKQPLAGVMGLLLLLVTGGIVWVLG